MSNEINRNTEISLQELQSKFVNVEETEYKTKGTMFLFSRFNTQKQEGENEVERLTQGELMAFAQNLQKYSTDDKLDINEIDAFVSDFNLQNPEEQITSQDVITFVDKIYKSYSLYNNNKVKSTPGVKPVGEPLSTNVVRMQCIINGQLETIELETRLHTTNDPQIRQVYVLNIIKGAEFKDILAKKYGFTGDNAWDEFTIKSLGKPNPNTYEFEFQPQYKSTMRNGINERDSARRNITNISSNEQTVLIGIDPVDNVKMFFVPDDIDKDPLLTLAEYEDPEVQKIMKDFSTYLTYSVEDSSKTLNAYLETYGATEWIADFLSHIWNNKYTVANTGNTYGQVDDAITKQLIGLMRLGVLNTNNLNEYKNRGIIDDNKFNELNALLESGNLNMMDNSYNGIINHNDFGAIFKEITGIEFDHKAVKVFLNFREQYLKEQSVIDMYHHVHNTLDNALKNFETKYDTLMSDNMFMKEQVYQEGMENGDTSRASMIAMGMAIDDEGLQKNVNKKVSLQNAKEELYQAFYPILCMSREKWNEMLAGLEAKEINPVKFLKILASNITQSVDKIAELTLQTSNPERINVYEKNLQYKYEATKSVAIGKSDLLDKVDKYHNSQVSGGAFVSAALQIGLYALGMAYLPLANGLLSGTSYAASYFTVEVVNRMVTKQDDLVNINSIAEILGNTAVEFSAGYLFDGFLKKILFGKMEDKALVAEKAAAEKSAMLEESAISKSQVAEESFTKFFGKKIDENTIMTVLGVRGVAAVSGGAKDGFKEFFKEILKGKFDFYAISSAVVIGAVFNALNIRLKKSDFVQKNHRILGKIIEKGPKKEIKIGIKETEQYYTKDQADDLAFIEDIKNSVIKDLSSKLTDEGCSELEEFINSPDFGYLVQCCVLVESFENYDKNQ